ncbi:uncharacterized protein BJ171DRAFT_565088 [Polychytrium aggregatum]|uniref:uncharacterized protein n=1 Tax=Polychytrium aggregatum TaxID=110093 RepID=UPI0022FE7FAE|nr:uncharacterized protein BJ171DRAFT_565088 [Polychytrium aggregatum]KAI9208567.1 hypothetical protein BJ171DRAFT_565088 [Polychytrium aggregatum]
MAVWTGGSMLAANRVRIPLAGFMFGHRRTSWVCIDGAIGRPGRSGPGIGEQGVQTRVEEGLAMARLHQSVAAASWDGFGVGAWAKSAARRPSTAHSSRQALCVVCTPATSMTVANIPPQSPPPSTAPADSTFHSASLARWNNDGVDGGPSSLTVILDWLRTPGNYAKWRGDIAGITKKALSAEIIAKLAEVKIVRSHSQISNKMIEFQTKYNQAAHWLATVGEGQQYDNQGKIKATLLKLCSLWVELHPIMSIDGPSLSPLALAAALAHPASAPAPLQPSTPMPASTSTQVHAVASQPSMLTPPGPVDHYPEGGSGFSNLHLLADTVESAALTFDCHESERDPEEPVADYPGSAVRDDRPPPPAVFGDKDFHPVPMALAYGGVAPVLPDARSLGRRLEDRYTPDREPGDFVPLSSSSKKRKRPGQRKDKDVDGDIKLDESSAVAPSSVTPPSPPPSMPFDWSGPSGGKGYRYDKLKWEMILGEKRLKLTERVRSRQAEEKREIKLAKIGENSRQFHLELAQRKREHEDYVELERQQSHRDYKLAVARQRLEVIVKLTELGYSKEDIQEELKYLY